MDLVGTHIHSGSEISIDLFFSDGTECILIHDGVSWSSVVIRPDGLSSYLN